jgi:Fe-S cluster biosynthesis and repair protein YggX
VSENVTLLRENLLSVSDLNAQQWQASRAMMIAEQSLASTRARRAKELEDILGKPKAVGRG